MAPLTWRDVAHLPGWGEALEAKASATLEVLAASDLLTGCLPHPSAIFRAFSLVPLADVRCVIIGQDPYPSQCDACGLSFSSPAPKLPRTLTNIFRELQEDVGGSAPASGDLTVWAHQSVLLANAGLTIGGDGKSHLPYWRSFTESWIATLASQRAIVWVLWGRKAQAWRPHIESAGFQAGKPPIIIESEHPSPLSARKGFFGSRPFSKVNAGLATLGLPPIDWTRQQDQEFALRG